MNAETKEQLISILSNFETRSNKDIQLLMELAFNAGQNKRFLSYEDYFNYIKRELLDL